MGLAVQFVDLAAQLAPNRAAYVAAFERLLDSGGFVGGAAVTDFETAFAAYTNADRAIAVRTGTDALVLILRAFAIGPGDEVITAASSFFATAEAISLVGATPVLADVDEEFLLLDPVDVAKRITKRTRAVIPVHLFGQVVDLAPFAELASAHRLRLIEDSAQAHGATRTGADGKIRRAGSIAEAAAFSFYPTKNLGALGEGGAITTSDAELAKRIHELRDHGQSSRHVHTMIGYNARLDAIQCAFLSISLRDLDHRNDARRRLAARYRERLAGVNGVRLISEPAGSRPVYHLMIARVDAARRDAVRDKLATAGVATAIHYPTPIHLQPVYASLGQAVGSCPVAERAAREMISLPMFPDLTLEQVDYVSESLAAALK